MNICFIGHRKIQENHNLVEEKLFSVLCCVIKDQINLNFFYGSKSEFNEIAYNAVKKLDNLNSKIKNIYVRAEYQYIDISYKNYLL